MADETQDPASQDTATPARPTGEGSPFAPNAEILGVENADLKDRLLRTMAEMENLRRRTEKEVIDARQYAVSAFAREILTIGDNLRRAIDAVPEDQRKTAEGALSALMEGVELTERELAKILGKHGVKLIEPDGQRFDPNLHQAMFEVDDPSVPSGTVVNVVQPGYTIGGRVLRPAMVGVSRGGPRPARGAPADEATTAQGAEPGIDRSV